MRPSLASLACVSFVTSVTLVTSASSQTPQYRSRDGVQHSSLPDTGAVARAESALASAPDVMQRHVDLGLAQIAIRQYREAIRTFSRAIDRWPDSVVLYRHRGHRHLSVREYDRARRDLERGFRLDSTNYGVLYHLGVVRYLRGEFAAAADAFSRAIRNAPDRNERAGSHDWLWMSLCRAGRADDARTMITAMPDSAIAGGYAPRIRLYRGAVAPEQMIGPADTAGVTVATLSYGLGNWYLLRGDTAAARAAFTRSVSATDGWPAFGFMASEIELRRLR